MLRSCLALACVAALATAAPVPAGHRALFAHHGGGHSGGGNNGAHAVMVRYINPHTGNCGDTRMGSRYMSSNQRAAKYTKYAIQYMNRRKHMKLQKGSCAQAGYRKFVGNKKYRWSYHQYKVKVYSKGGSSSSSGGKSIVALAVATPALSTLVAAVKAAGFANLFSRPGHFTVFAPTNAAFSALPAGLLSELLEPHNKDKLQQILKYHVHVGNVYSRQLRDGMHVSTLEGKSLTVGIDHMNGKTTIDIIGGKPSDVANVVLKLANIKASNGVVHVINKVLIPADFTLGNAH